VSRRPAVITQADIARVLRAMHQVAYPGALEIAPDGTMRVVPASAGPTDQGLVPARSATHRDGASVDDSDIIDL